MKLLRLSAHTLRREWHLPEMRTLGAALLLAVVALGTVATLAARVEHGVLASAAQLIGGDAGLSAPAAIPGSFAQQAQQRGLAASRTASFPSVAFMDDRSQLLDVVAADSAWPLRGQLRLSNAQGQEHKGHGPPPGQVYLDQRALVGLGITVGETIQLGGRKVLVTARIVSQPDGGQLVALAPRAVMNLQDAQAAGLLGTGSRARHRLLVSGMPAPVQAWQTWARQHKPEAAELITPQQVQQRMRNAFARAGAFLRLAALLAALLAGVAIALAARQYARRKTDEVALLRALGTPRRQIWGLLGLTLALLAIPVTLLATATALGLSQLAWLAARSLFADVPTVLPLQPALAAAAVGLAVLTGFALPPLMRLARVSPVAVFRRQFERRTRLTDLGYLLPVAVAVGLIWLQSESLRLAGILAASLLGVAVVAALLATALLWLARRLAPGAHPALRLGLAALSRRSGLSVLQSTALALGVTAMLLLGVIAPALLDGWRQELPADTPNWFVLNLQPDQRAGFDEAITRLGADQLNMLPLAVGKLTAINGKPIDDMAFENPRASDRADRQLRLSWSARLPPANTVIAGQWQGAAPAEASVSIDEMWRDLYGLKPGDRMRFQVGETSLDTRVSSIRKVDWSSFRVNFFLLLDPAHAGKLPHTFLASFHLPAGHASQLAQLSRDYPNLSLIDVDALLNRIRGIIVQVSSAVRWVLGFSLLAGALVLLAALATSTAERRQEAALLRTLGAQRAQLRVAAACEFALLGLISGLTAAFGATAAGLWLAREVFHIDGFTPPLLPLGIAALAAALLVMLLGLAGTRRVTRTPPLALLRRT